MGQEIDMQDPLVGKGFLCFRRKSKLKSRGDVVARMRDGYYRMLGDT